MYSAAAARAAALSVRFAAVCALKGYAVAELRRRHFLEAVKIHVERFDVAVADGDGNVDHEIVRRYEHFARFIDARGVEQRIKVHLVIIEKQTVHFRHRHAEFGGDACGG